MIGWLKRRLRESCASGSSWQARKPGERVDFPEIESKWLSRVTVGLSRIKDEGLLTVALVSSVPGEGVSTVAVNLARDLHRALNWRVVLIDANLPNPSLHYLSGDIAGKGLGEVLRGEMAAEAAMQHLDEPGLGLIPAGSCVGTELGALFNRNLMAGISPAIDPGKWDAVIVDCPPLLPYPGTGFIAAQADATVVVVRAESTRFRVAGKALNNLRENDAKVIGVILNNARFYVPEWLYRRL